MVSEASPVRMAWQQAAHTAHSRWAALGLREQRGLQLAAAAVAIALVWSVALAPALRSLKTSAAQSTQLAAAAERMQALQARAKKLQSQPAVAPQESLKALQAAAATFGKGANLQVIGEQATLTLTQVSAQSLAAWLASESATTLSPSLVHLRRDAGGTEALWSGTLLFRLPSANRGTP